MTTPFRVQLSRAKGWRMPANTVRVSRPSLFGNPFVHPDPAQAVAAFRQLCEGVLGGFSMARGGLQFAKNAHPNTLHWAWREWLTSQGLPSIQGKNLACWCKPGQPCHADVLLELANRQVTP